MSEIIQLREFLMFEKDQKIEVEKKGKSDRFPLEVIRFF